MYEIEIKQKLGEIGATIVEHNEWDVTFTLNSTHYHVHYEDRTHAYVNGEIVFSGDNIPPVEAITDIVKRT